MFKSLTEYNNYRINLNCCIAMKAVKVSNLLSTNNDCAEIKSQELFLLNAYNEILCKYKPKIITEECTSNYKPSIFEKTISTKPILVDNSTLTLYVNNIIVTQIVASGNIYLAFEELLKSSNLTYYIINKSDDSIIYQLMLNCSTDTIYATVEYNNSEGTSVITTIPIEKMQEGNCNDTLVCEETIIDPIGCLSEDSYKKIINNINSLCEFCNCNQ